MKRRSRRAEHKQKVDVVIGKREEGKRGREGTGIRKGRGRAKSSVQLWAINRVHRENIRHFFVAFCIFIKSHFCMKEVNIRFSSLSEFPNGTERFLQSISHRDTKMNGRVFQISECKSIIYLSKCSMGMVH